MTTFTWTLLVIVALIAGAAGGFFLARRYMMNYFQENPPISEEMIASMLTQMGQKPSAKRVRQITQSMRGQGRKK
ncbi:hypothetical protein AWM75_02000 [Aerococcus urinaehominis]|uniref:Uncharacterized protein n=1 Tax=Aerococcus urinaehominis TaxID=128944 RepID=A0A0X8FK71_9LACT|nr:YneF family protein [Aerococcus urinaehominis]AMB98838.1 hypothetical protein AWM75_02000 [Aerococcus urinaehominis]SDM17683.1 hypothetical protein SAMN04487985_10766 [Aerococcus urinaehominis]